MKLSVFLLISISMTLISLRSNAQILELKNQKVTLHNTLEGSAFTRFVFNDQDTNPLDWKLPDERLPSTNTGGFSFQGHFLSLGTWGMPSKGEQEAGIKFYGEVNTQRWKLLEKAQQTAGATTYKTQCLAPVEKLHLTREVRLLENSSVTEVTEVINNELPIGRPYNILQHVTLGGDFLKPGTILDSNAGKGFLQNGDFKREDYSIIEAESYDWPIAEYKGKKIDLRLSGSFEKTYVSSHVFNEGEKYGWVTAINPAKALLIGYLWEVKDYPWLNVWHQYENEAVKGLGLEFATCGMWNSFEYMMTHDSRFYNNNSFEFIDAGESKQKGYKMFLAKIPQNTIKVTKVSDTKEGILLELTLKNGSSETLKL